MDKSFNDYLYTGNETTGGHINQDFTVTFKVQTDEPSSFFKLKPRRRLDLWWYFKLLHRMSIGEIFNIDRSINICRSHSLSDRMIYTTQSVWKNWGMLHFFNNMFPQTDKVIEDWKLHLLMNLTDAWLVYKSKYAKRTHFEDLGTVWRYMLKYYYIYTNTNFWIISYKNS